MVHTFADLSRPTKGIIVTAVVTGVFAVALATFFGVSTRGVIATSLIYGVFVAMCIGIGMALIDVVKYFERRRSHQ